MQHSQTDEAPRCAPYPLFVRLQGEPVVVVGGGQVAERKVASLLDAGAIVTLVAPEATEGLQALAREGHLTWLSRPYQLGDTAGALLTVCATGDPDVDAAVYAEASKGHRLVNVVDVPDLCNAIVPSVLQRGRLQVAVSTGGASPSEAREIRRSLEEQFPAWWETYLDVLAELRCLVKQRVSGPAEVRAPLYEAVRKSDVRDRVAAGQAVDAEEVYAQVVAPLVALRVKEAHA